ncbi:hypothetical protein [Cerasicoccus frondis]|uniref:hypothetical protein n=1 Tax=Cerasicoccus frondis TaxID=490090 RepID=UPI0028529CAD|nr:hypothetical protein [Cerasicoccus frondis]
MLKNLIRLKWLGLCVAICVSLGAPLKAEDLLSPHYTWKFNAGPEFPGAEGSVDSSQRGLALSYDFSEGGKYVSVDSRVDLSPDDKELRFKAEADRPLRLAVRFIDSSGQTFQCAMPYVTPNVPQPFRVDLSSIDKSKSWGGAKDGKVHYPIKTIRICLNAPSEEYASTGAISISEIIIND